MARKSKKPRKMFLGIMLSEDVYDILTLYCEMKNKIRSEFIESILKEYFLKIGVDYDKIIQEFSQYIKLSSENFTNEGIVLDIKNKMKYEISKNALFNIKNEINKSKNSRGSE